MTDAFALRWSRGRDASHRVRRSHAVATLDEADVVIQNMAALGGAL
jgi:hypothetical protein